MIAFSLFAAETEVVAIASSDVAGKKYILHSVDGEVFAGEKQPFVEFDDDMNMTGAVCNRFRGSATVENGILRSAGVVATRMMCPDEKLTALESAFFRELENGLVLRFDENGDLVMQNADIDLIFRPDYEGAEADEALAGMLAGRKFVLRTMGGEAFEADDAAQPYIEFGQDMHVSGRACNQFSGQGRLREGRLQANRMAATLMLCVNPVLQQFEDMFHEMLRSGGNIALDGKTLRMEGNGLQLEFVED
jgi:Heat shock protein